MWWPVLLSFLPLSPKEGSSLLGSIDSRWVRRKLQGSGMCPPWDELTEEGLILGTTPGWDTG